MKYTTPPAECSTGGGSHLPPQTKFLPWQPSTWPDLTGKSPTECWICLERIFNETIISEIGNVISDAQKVNGSVEHRGHVIALALFCAIDALSSYAFLKSEDKYERYVKELFPDSYTPYAHRLYDLYRNWLVHSWNLFEPAITPDDAEIHDVGGSLSLGLLNFFNALKQSVENLKSQVFASKVTQYACLDRYEGLRKHAKP